MSFTAQAGARGRLVQVGRLGLALTLLLLTVPAAAAETILSLGVLRAGKLDAKVSRVVHERLTHAGETAPPTAHLAATERQCAVPACLDPLAAREKAQLVLSARVQQSAGFSYLAAFLYDVANQRSMDVSAVCDKCLPEALALRVGDLYERLLRDYRERQRAEAAGPSRAGKAAAAASSPPANAQSASPTDAASPTQQTAAKSPTDAASPAQPVAANNPPDAEPAARVSPVPMDTKSSDAVAGSGSRRSEHGFNLSPRRKIIAGVLGGLGVAALITSIALNVTDGKPTTLDCDVGSAMAKVCVLDHKAAYSVGYAVTTAFAVGVGMTLFWPESAKSTRTEVK